MEELSDLQEILERSIYSSIQQRLVSNGYLPDINAFDIENPDINISKVALEAYNTAITAIKNSAKGFAIELFSFSSNQSKGLSKVPRIVINTLTYQPGTLGGDTAPNYKLDQQSGFYLKNQKTSLSSDFYFNIYTIGNTTQQMRVMNSIVLQSLPRRGYIKKYTENTLEEANNLFVNYLSGSIESNMDQGYIERVFMYMIPDAFEADDKLLTNDIAPISDITIKDGNNNDFLNIQ